MLYKCGKLLNKAINNKDNVDIENVKNMERAFKKLLTMISDIVVLNRNSLEYSRMFLKSGKWCGFMIEKGLMFHPDSVLQFITEGVQRNYCVEQQMLVSLKQKLKQIIAQNTPKNNKDKDVKDEEEEAFYDEELLSQSSNMLRYIEQNFDIDRKTEL